MEIKIGGKTRFENLLKLTIIPFALVGYDVIITNLTRATRSLVILSLHIQRGLME